MNLKQYLYNGLVKEKAESGDLLIAEPMMEDTFFGRSVCLIVDEPTPDSHAGLLLNKPLDISLNQLLPDSELPTETRIYCGGPVELERLSVLHTLGDQLGASAEIKPGLFIGADIDLLLDYLRDEEPVEDRIRLFLGYCGWGEKQLESETERLSWAINKNRGVKGLLTGEGLAYWQREVKNMGEDLKSWLNVPLNPYCN